MNKYLDQPGLFHDLIERLEENADAFKSRPCKSLNTQLRLLDYQIVSACNYFNSLKLATSFTFKSHVIALDNLWVPDEWYFSYNPAHPDTERDFTIYIEQVTPKGSTAAVDMISSNGNFIAQKMFEEANKEETPYFRGLAVCTSTIIDFVKAYGKYLDDLNDRPAHS